MALLGIALLLMEDQHTAMRFLAPMAHCLGCLVGIVFGLYFNHLGINAVSGCLLGIIFSALIMQSIRVMFLMCVTLAGLDLGRVLGLFFLKRFCLALFHYARWVLTVFLSALSGDDDEDKFFMAVIFIITCLILTITHNISYQLFFALILGLFAGFFGIAIVAIADKEYEYIYFVSPILVCPTLFAAVGWYYFDLIGIPICTFTGLFYSQESL